MLLDLGYKREELVINANKDTDEEKAKKWETRIEAISLYIQKKKESWLESENFLKETKTSISGKRKNENEKTTDGYKTETKILRNTLKESLPSVEEFAVSINISRKQVYNWSDDNEEFKEHLHTLGLLAEISIKEAVNKGLMSDTFGRFILSARYNYREKSDITTNDKEIFFSNEHKEKTDNAITDFLTKENEEKANTPADT